MLLCFLCRVVYSVLVFLLKVLIVFMLVMVMVWEVVLFMLIC